MTVGHLGSSVARGVGPSIRSMRGLGRSASSPMVLGCCARPRWRRRSQAAHL